MRDHPYQPSIMIRFFIVSGILLAYSTVIFSYTPLQNDVVHICCYSNDPSAYTPNCYDCNSMVYKNALMACMNSTELPKNITYKAATCLEKNCQIQPPKPPESEDLKNNPFIDIVSKILAIVRNKRSVFDNNIDGSSETNRHVVKEVQTLVSIEDMPMKLAEPEYIE
ncbi:uncharacterized protein CDAR_430181 [Caerostris darwini]|uniref:Uncharacterized protein n=2 Tax=Caerostris TaxID=172845 RepID=A0AAV4TLY1_9ARAC|nr:uncharacterized protein CDAR_430181 [Caerostris darwini]GIY96636.1 uncharacterized protein CEXT_519351 [Caerostris extrusa]